MAAGRTIGWLIAWSAAVCAVWVRTDERGRIAADQPAAGVAEEAADPAVVRKQIEQAIRRNGPIFAEWTAPRFALVLTGDLTGYIEPCGCAGLENLKGGLSRRHTLLEALRAARWSVAAFDLGGQVRRVGVPQTEMKYQSTVRGLIGMGYSAVGFGADDVRMPAATLLAAALEPVGDQTLPLTSADTLLFSADSGATRPFRIVELAGRRIGVTSVLSDAVKQTISNEGIVFTPAEQALAEVAPRLAAERCDVNVLLSYGSPAESEALARKFPQFHYVVTSGGADEPPGDFRAIEGSRARLIEVGQKGQHAIVLGFYDDPNQPVRYQRVPLDARFPESPRMKQLLVDYQDQLRVAGFENLGVTEKLHPRYVANDPRAAQFVGSESCKKCHADAYDVWAGSGHAHATETLVKLKPARHSDPECLRCLVPGWEPQQYLPFQTGYLSLEKTPHLTGNGCENCHGPGGAHVAAEAGADVALQQRLRAAMHVSVETIERTNCLKCHDHDNSPEFKFETYWPQIEH